MIIRSRHPDCDGSTKPGSPPIPPITGWHETKVDMKNAMYSLVLLLTLSLSMPAPAVLAWGDDGHQIVGRIAARKLTAPAKRRIVAILREGGDDSLHLPMLLGAPNDPQPSLTTLAEALGRIATWPDHMLGGKGATGPWHFVDFGLFEGPNTTANRCATGCITEQITQLIASIRANTSLSVLEEPGVTRTFAVDKELRFLIHLFGDIHQPLHVSTNADAGGNCEKTTGFTGSSNLHSVWDTAIVTLVEKPTLDATAKALLNEFQSNVLAGGITDPKQIAGESFALAQGEIYPKTKPTAISVIDHFVDLTPSECATKAPLEIRSASVNGPASFDNASTQQLVREQLFKAGVRLATVLNSLFM
jgi:hypothetical protein